MSVVDNYRKKYKLNMSEIIFENVKVGDEIRATTTYPNGTEVVVTGIVSGNRINLTSSDDVCIVASTFRQETDETSVVIELLNRVEPRDHVVIGTLKDGSKYLARAAALYTESDAEKEADYLNDIYRERTSSNDKYAYSTYKAVALSGL